MKLKDFKNDPEKYKTIVKNAKERGIEVNDETDISDLIGKFKTVNAMIMNAGRKLDKRRQGII